MRSSPKSTIVLFQTNKRTDTGRNAPISKRRSSSRRKLNPALKSHRPRGLTRTLRRSVLYALKEEEGIPKRAFRKVRALHRKHSYDGGRRPIERKLPKKRIREMEAKHALSDDTEAKLEFLMGHMIPTALKFCRSAYVKRERGPLRRTKENARRVRQLRALHG